MRYDTQEPGVRRHERCVVLFSQEVEALHQKIQESSVLVEVDSPDSNLAETINKIRAQYDKLAKKNQKETNAWYQSKVRTHSPGCSDVRTFVSVFLRLFNRMYVHMFVKTFVCTFVGTFVHTYANVTFVCFVCLSASVSLHQRIVFVVISIVCLTLV